mgnify:CR=1 FL=1
MKKPHIQWPEQWLRRRRIPSIGFSYSGKDFIISMSLYTLSVVLCLILRGASQNGDTGYVYMIFLLDVFLTALLTEGFFFSLIISIFAVLSVDYIFTPPYWNVSFTLSGFPLTFLVTMTISVVTGIVTSRAKQMDEVRREAELERMHGNLLRAVSHDIRTPLTAIVGSASGIIDNYDALSKENILELLEDMKSEGQWLVRMVENLLSITRIGDGTARINKEDELVEDVISGAITKFRKRFPDIEVVPKVPEDVLFVPMDAILIEQVIVNLLENCVLHADGMTKIWLIVTEDGDQVKFSVEDDGAGIEESVLPRMFDGSFQSEDGKESDSKRNMGIGLSVCMTIVRAHDGIMKAENRKEGGARVMFWLPKGVDTEYGD